jgi:hypothetical protein
MAAAQLASQRYEVLFLGLNAKPLISFRRLLFLKPAKPVEVQTAIGGQLKFPTCPVQKSGGVSEKGEEGGG